MKKDSDKTKKQLIAELTELRKKNQEQKDKLKAENQQLRATEQQLKAANQQLSASEAKFKNLLLLKKAILESPESIVVFALDKNYCYIDFTLQHKQTMKAIWDVDIKIGDNILDYIKFKPDRKKAKKNFDKALKGEQFVLYEEYGDEKLKRTFYEDRYSPVYDENNNIIGLSVYVIDITERKQAEEKLKEKETFLKTIFDGIQEPMHVIDRDYKVLLTNKQLLEMKNVKQEDIRGKYCYEAYQGRNEHCEQCGAKEVFKTGKPYSLIKFLPLPDGTYGYFNVYSFPLFEESGEVTQVIEITRDITERKRAEKALKESELRLKSLINGTPDIICFKDGKGRWLVANDADLELFSLQHTDYFGKIDAELAELTDPIYKESLLLCMESDEKSWQSKTLSRGNEVIPTVNGTKKVYDVIKVPLFEPDGARKGLVVLGRDITERKRAEQQLHNEREKLLVTLQSIGDGVVTTDTEGRVTFINRVAKQLTGWNQEEAAGQPLSEVFNIINEKTGEPVENPVRKVLKSGKIIGLANHAALIARDGTRRNIADSGAPILDSQGKIIGVVLVFRDVTEKRKREEEQLKIEKLESVGVLAGGIAHDFNNILTAILGNISLADIYIEKGHKAHLLLQAAEKASLRAKDLTQQLLTFSKGGDPFRKTASIKQVITDSADFVLHGSNVRCSYAIPKDLWLVDIDTGQMSQVIQNLVINARHAMPAGGEINIACENIADITTETALSLEGEEYIKITIADHGCGIPEKYLDKIFDPYFSTKQQGSGLGLAITHSIITKHDGHISVRSKPDEGTMFTIYLPASAEQKSKDSEEETKKTEKTARATILVMDDEEMIQDLVKKMLSLLGHEVLLAKDGEDAITIFGKHQSSDAPVDVIIMDLTIPGGMGGKEAIKEILKIDPEAKAIVSSGYANDPVMANYGKYGFKAAISKPFEMDQLKKTINSVLG